MDKKTGLNKQFDKQFGAYVKQLRLGKKWSQEDLASAIDNDYQNISRLERGGITPNLYWCHRLAEAFGMNLSEFFQGFEFKKRK